MLVGTFRPMLPLTETGWSVMMGCETDNVAPSLIVIFLLASPNAPEVIPVLLAIAFTMSVPPLIVVAPVRFSVLIVTLPAPFFVIAPPPRMLSPVRV